MFTFKVLAILALAAFMFAQAFDVSFEPLAAYATGTQRVVQQ